ncbi:MAG: DMT family transporter [Crocinitomicaceae bacterium]|nr:DMT family transporter [Crocinitomicaceae bacterium]
MKGIFYILISTTCFALVNLCVKILAGSDSVFELETQDYSPFQIVFFRSIISLSICIAIIKAKGIPFFGNNKKWLIVRGVFGATALTLFFYTIKNLPLAIATTVQYLSPVFTVIFAIFLVNEKVKPIQWLYFAISFAGVVLIGLTKGDVNTAAIDPFWVIMGVVSALGSGIAYNAIMKCRLTDAPITIVMYFPLISTPITLIISLANGFVIPQGAEWILILIIGIFTQIAQIYMTKALHAEKASIVTPFKYFGAIYAIFIGSFVFFEDLVPMLYLGILLIISGVLLNSIGKIMDSFRKKLS